jgi:hypothetical protein
VGLTFASTVYVPDWKEPSRTPKSALSEQIARSSDRRGSWMAG